MGIVNLRLVVEGIFVGWYVICDVFWCLRYFFGVLDFCSFVLFYVILGGRGSSFIYRRGWMRLIGGLFSRLVNVIFVIM